MNRMQLTLRSALAAVVVAAGLWSAPAAAQDRTGSWEITPFAGGFFGGQIYDGYPTGAGNRVRLDLGTTPTYGGRFGYNFNRAFGLEVEYGYAKPSINVDNDHCCVMGSGTVPYPNASVGHATIHMWDMDALFNFGKKAVIGYFAMGLGGTTVSPDVANAGSDTRFSMNLGGGVKFFFTPHVGLRVDGRYRTTDTGHHTNHYTWCDYYYCYTYGSEWASSGTVTGGLTFAF